LAAVTAALLIACALGGLVAGGICNTVIVRAPEGESLLHPGPQCPECRAPIAWRDTIPVVSWFALGRRCRSCAEPIPSGYPLVEVANAVLWVAAGLRFGTSWVLIPYLFLFSVLLAQSVIDLELYRLLDRITFPAVGVSLAMIAAVSLIEGEPRAVLGALIGGIAYFLFLFLPFIVYPRGMGFGDVKLALLMGLHLGWLHPILPLFAVLAASLLGSVAGVAIYVARRGKSREFPFGPWLALGCVLTILGSDWVLDNFLASA
jgi:leader peptidase (prepilin peptidase)/N-methyltransferase